MKRELREITNQGLIESGQEGSDPLSEAYQHHPAPLGLTRTLEALPYSPGDATLALWHFIRVQ